MKTLKELMAQLGTVMAEDASDQRDQKAAELLTQLEAAVDETAKGYVETSALKTQVEQLRTDLDAETEARRNVERIGLGLSKGAILLPSGRAARMDMLADKRGFADDETAKRFGAHCAVLLMKTHKRYTVDDLPKYTREVAEAVAKDAAGFEVSGRMKASPDIEPGVAGSGSEFVSNEFRAELIRNAEVYGTVFPECNRVPLNTLGSTTWPKQTADLTAYWTAIAATITQSGPTTTSISMTPEQCATLTGIPNIMFADPGLLVDLGNLLGIMIPEALAYLWDNALINGDGSATYGGITGLLNSGTISAVAAAAGNTTIATLDYDDIDEVEGSLSKSVFYNNAKWFMHYSVAIALLNKKDANGQYLYRLVNDAGVRLLKGYPIVKANLFEAASAITTGESYAVFGDMRRAFYFGMLRALEIATSEHVWFDQAMTAVRGLAYVDAAEADGDAVVTCATA